jgi:hypothetical protein
MSAGRSIEAAQFRRDGDPHSGGNQHAWQAQLAACLANSYGWRQTTPVKVVIVAPYFYPSVGGAEVYTINIARQLKAMGWEVVIVTTGKRHTSAPESIEGMPLHRLRTLIKISNTPIGLRWRRNLRRIFQIEQPDLIRTWPI